ncbi:TlpA disulfide reductase family protein [Proteiniphilum sp.]|uniref:TlpA disulfide reductase family protein n=1 Tax=Proteiniphilum sp. TaxID=1926877 RepID=UPI002B201D99|nr:TlpA disulfide reductase family protein [Proteiniphilum sp.]MEA4917302.1 TlpA disulfide reductase family protein [Proteiniphilum sp.]
MQKLYIITLILLTGCKQVDNKFELSGTVIGDTDAIVVLIQAGQSRFDAETSPIIDGKFHITGSLEYPEEFSLMTEKSDQSIFNPLSIFIAPNDKIGIELNTKDIEKSIVKGSLVHDEFQQYLKIVDRYVEDLLDQLRDEYYTAEAINDTLKMREIEIQAAELKELKGQRAYKYIKNNPKSFVSAYSLYENKDLFDTKQVDELLSLLDKSLHNSKHIYDIVHADRNQPGKKASDFTLKDSQNNDITFSKFAKDKIVLMEFWASWCGPCRKANPKLEAIYQQYKGQGFEILGISQDRDIQVLQESIAKDQITWINLLDVKGINAVTRLYNYSSLPANILIDRNGIVVARNINIYNIENEIIKLLR